MKVLIALVRPAECDDDLAKRVEVWNASDKMFPKDVPVLPSKGDSIMDFNSLRVTDVYFDYQGRQIVICL